MRAVRGETQSILKVFKTEPQSSAIGLDVKCEEAKGDRTTLGLGFWGG